MTDPSQEGDGGILTYPECSPATLGRGGPGRCWGLAPLRAFPSALGSGLWSSQLSPRKLGGGGREVRRAAGAGALPLVPQVSFLTQSLTGAPKPEGRQALAPRADPWLLPAGPKGGRGAAGRRARPGRGVGDKGSRETILALSSLQGAAQGGPAPLAGSSLGLEHTASPSSLTPPH